MKNFDSTSAEVRLGLGGFQANIWLLQVPEEVANRTYPYRWLQDVNAENIFLSVEEAVRIVYSFSVCRA